MLVKAAARLKNREETFHASLAFAGRLTAIQCSFGKIMPRLQDEPISDCSAADRQVGSAAAATKFAGCGGRIAPFRRFRAICATPDTHGNTLLL